MVVPIHALQWYRFADTVSLLNERPEIPWLDVIGIRNHIAHGYFDIDGDIVFDVIKNNLDDLLAAINYFISKF